jgi:hypothetical protein
MSKIITQCYNIKILKHLKYIYLCMSKLKIKSYIIRVCSTLLYHLHTISL